MGQTHKDHRGVDTERANVRHTEIAKNSQVTSSLMIDYRFDRKSETDRQTYRLSQLNKNIIWSFKKNEFVGFMFRNYKTNFHPLIVFHTNGGVFLLRC